MKKIFTALLAGAAFIATMACAQNAGPVDPQTLAAAKELQEAMRYRELLVASAAEMAKSMPQQIRATLAAGMASRGLTEQQQARALALVDGFLPEAVAAAQGVFDDPALIDQMAAENALIYARYYTAAELRQLAAFQRTPLGQKSFTIGPKLAFESQAISNRILMPRVFSRMDEIVAKLTPKMLEAVEAEMKLQAAERAKK
jgi:hypothetical protein